MPTYCHSFALTQKWAEIKLYGLTNPILNLNHVVLRYFLVDLEVSLA